MDREALKRLTGEWKATKTDPQSLPERLPLDSLEVIPGLFQPRFKADHSDGVVDGLHVEALRRTLREQKEDLDPLLVLRVGARNIVIDGHHRLKAYRRTKGRKDAPVRFFDGTPEEAMVEAAKENAKDRLLMPKWERWERAWSLMRLGIGTKASIARSTGTSDGTIANMRKKLKEYSAQGIEPPESWAEAKGGRIEQGEQRYPAMVEDFKNRLVEAFPVMNNRMKADLFADALIAYGPQFSVWVAQKLVSELELLDELNGEEETEEEQRKDLEF